MPASMAAADEMRGTAAGSFAPRSGCFDA